MQLRPLSLLAALGLVAIVVGAGTLLGVVQLALRGLHPSESTPWTSALLHAIAFSLAIWVGLQGAGDGSTPDALGMRRFRPILALGLVPLAFGASVLLSELDNWVQHGLPAPPEEIERQARILSPVTALDRTGILLWIALVAPVVEESFFRGILQQRLAVRYGAGVALLATAGAFTFFHDLRVYPQTFVTGLGLGWIAQRSRSVAAAALAHAAYNAAPLVITAGLFPVAGWNLVDRARLGEPDHVGAAALTVAFVGCFAGLGATWWLSRPRAAAAPPGTQT